MFRPVLIAALLVGAVLVSGCADRAPTLPDKKQMAAPTPTETVGPGPWQDDFAEAELDEYAAALARWEDYQEKAAPIYREGKATADSLALFEEFFMTPDAMQTALEGYEERGVKVVGEVQILWSRAGSVTSDERGTAVVVEQCINVARTSIVEGGRTIASPHRLPILRSISLASIEGAPYQVFSYAGPENGKVTDCEQ
ncbi:hypothetical protein [Nocardioides sp. AE5]|uniref:hypothetical protein n=1 Tax=Nocardioides sp. AE5 TaxID=2962573 RepID=UPI002881D391|nr:hypothetical protein [Nocardioides sp. AE5]MDT0201876.1 hypothetical protein [Nocardioides sp. AE5]